MSVWKVLVWFSSAVFVSSYEFGVPHNYKYETTVVVSEDCSDVSDPVGHKLEANVQLTAVWRDATDPAQKLMKIQVSDVKLHALKKGTLVEQKTELEAAQAFGTLFLLQNNRIKSFFDDPSEHTSLRNLKRSLASLLQLQKQDGQAKEEDVSGSCDAFYKIESSVVRKVKTNCLHPLQNEIFSQATGVRSLDFQHSVGVDCDVKDGSSDVVSQCMAVEQVKTSNNLWKKSSVCVKATSQFRLVGTVGSNGKGSPDGMEEILKKEKVKAGSLVAISEEPSQPTTLSAAEATNSFKGSIKSSSLAKLKSASAFFKMLPAYKAATKEDILKVLKNKKFQDILAQIMDVLAATSTQDSIEAVFSFFKDEKSYNEIFERYLISLAVLPRPKAFILAEIKSFLEKGKLNDKIESTLITTIGSLYGTYSRNMKPGEKDMESILDFLVASLEKCRNEECRLTRLRGLRNAGHPKTVPLLMQYALKGGKPALEALMAVRNIIKSYHPTQETTEQLLKVFNQVGAKQESSVRSTAAEILLRTSQEYSTLKSVLGSLTDRTDLELSTFLVSKLMDLVNENEELRSRVFPVLSEKEIGHYYALSQKGKSSTFKRKLIETEDLNVTYGINMELLEGGLLKRSSFDVDFDQHGIVSNLLSVGMFAEGVGSLAGAESSEEGVDPTAGMELTVLGSSIRPYVFFRGTSELMGHAWSGTASELTPALQGIFFLSDDQRVHVLHNGMVVRLELKGALSTDLSAAVQISLWSRNSQTQVRSAAALLMRGSAIVDSMVAQSRGEYILYGQSSINFDTDLDFYEAPFKMCTQMQHPDVTVRHDFQKSFEVTGSKYSFKKMKKRKRFIPSKSYSLHQKNSDFCRIMKSE